MSGLAKPVAQLILLEGLNMFNAGRQMVICLTVSMRLSAVNKALIFGVAVTALCVFKVGQ